MATYRFTYRSEIYIEADSPQEAWKKVLTMPLEELKENSDFLDWEIAENADTYDDVWDEIKA